MRQGVQGSITPRKTTLLTALENLNLVVGQRLGNGPHRGNVEVNGTKSSFGTGVPAEKLCVLTQWCSCGELSYALAILAKW